MKNHKLIAVCLILLSSLLICSCDGTYAGSYKSFDSKLRGTWASNETGLYAGTLAIGYDTITIDGYGEDWTSLVGDDAKRPFRELPKRVPLPGYSEGGSIFIKYGSADEYSVPYLYTEVGTYPQKYRLLEFDFGGRKEILQSAAEY